MKMIVFTIILTLAILIIGDTGTAQAGQEIEHCGVGDVASISRAAPQGYSQIASGHPTPGIPASLNRCQARLYDDNGPDIPHTWCEQDLFLLGILIFSNYKSFDTDRNSEAAFLEQLTHQVFWESESETIELELIRTATRDVVHPALGHLLVFQDFAILGHPALQPGYYMWDFVQKHPIAVEPGNPEGIVFTAEGEVEIVSHQEHISRVISGSW